MKQEKMKKFRIGLAATVVMAAVLMAFINPNKKVNVATVASDATELLGAGADLLTPDARRESRRGGQAIHRRPQPER